MGLTVRDVTEPMARRLRLPTTAGVLVTGVRPGHPAQRAKPPVARKDLLTHVNGEEVSSVAALREALRKAAGRETMAVTLLRGEESLVTVLETDAGETDLGGGELPKGWIGVSTQPLIPTVARALGVEGVRGLRITRVHPGSAAETAGLKTGDIVLELNDRALPARSPHDQGMLGRRFESLAAGSDAKLTILRDGERSSIMVKVEESPASAAAARVLRNDFLEFRARDLTFADRLKERLATDAAGVLVTEVTNGGWAALGGLHFGDLILRIGEHEISTVADLEKALRWIEKERPSHIGFFVRRGTRTTVFYAEPEYDPLD
jgi:S1-C subfamily serine protease